MFESKSLKDDLRQMTVLRDTYFDKWKNAEVHEQREINDLKSAHRRELEDMKHLVKMKQEALEVEYKKKELDLETKHSKSLLITNQEEIEGLVNILSKYDDIIEKLLSVVPTADVLVTKKGK